MHFKVSGGMLSTPPDFSFLGCLLAVAAHAIAIPSTLMFSVGPGSRFGGFVGGDRLITF